MKKPGFTPFIPGIFLAISIICLAGLTIYLFVTRPEGKVAGEPYADDAAADPLLVGPAEEGEEPRGRLVLIIDDAGYDNRSLDLFLSFPGPLAVSVLPGLAGSGEAAEKVRAAGKELMLHLPMEPEGSQDPGPGALYGWMDEDQLRDLVFSHIDSLPGVVGVNNHMGSRGSADERLMRIALGAMKEKGLFFLDSRTTASSEGRDTAEALNLPFLERDVFLDNEQDKTAIREALDRAKDRAEKQGHAVMIGHVWCSELAEVLLEVYPELLDEGYRFYPVTELLQGVSFDDGSGD